MTSNPQSVRNREFAWVLHDVFRHFQRSWNRRLRASGVGISPAQCRVLATLYGKDGYSQTQLAEDVQMDKAPLGRLLDRMEEVGLVERKPDPHDRRVRRVYQTSAAELLDEPVWNVANGLFDHALSGLTPAQIATLMELLEHLKQNLQGDEAPKPAG